MGSLPRVLRVVEAPADDFMEAERESFARMLLEHLPPVEFRDFSGGPYDNNSGFCPNWPVVGGPSGGEVVLDDSLRTGTLRPQIRRRRMLSTYAHETAHRLTRPEVDARQAHGAVFAAVCAALTARILGETERGLWQIGWYDVQDCPQAGLALEHAADFAKEHFGSGAPARDLPDLARSSWARRLSEAEAPAAAARAESAALRLQRDREAERAQSLEGRLATAERRREKAEERARERDRRALAAEKAKTLGWGEISGALFAAGLLGAILGSALF